MKTEKLKNWKEILNKNESMPAIVACQKKDKKKWPFIIPFEKKLQKKNYKNIQKYVPELETSRSFDFDPTGKVFQINELKHVLTVSFRMEYKIK